MVETFTFHNGIVASWERLVRFEALDGSINYGEPVQKAAPFTEARVLDGDLFGSHKLSDRVVRIKKILAPVDTGEIIGIGVNFKRFATLLNIPLPEYPLVFRKGRGSIQHPGGPIILPKIASNPPECDYEVELAVIIARPCKNVTKAQALDYVLGYTVANDMSARLWHGKKGGNQLCFAKCFDTFFPFGPVIVSPKLVNDPQNLALKTWVNGELRQNSNTSDMNFGVADLISFLSNSTTLLPGTVISTGTPEGTGSSLTPPVFLKHGDVITCEVESIGQLTNPVEDEK